MEKEPPRRTESRGSEPERSIEAPSLIWWMLAAVAIMGFAALAFMFGRMT
jgi:hypothetical protein